METLKNNSYLFLLMKKRQVSYTDLFIFSMMVFLSFLILYYASKLTIPIIPKGENIAMLLIAIGIYAVFIFYILLKSQKKK